MKSILISGQWDQELGTGKTLTMISHCIEDLITIENSYLISNLKFTLPNKLEDRFSHIINFYLIQEKIKEIYQDYDVIIVGLDEVSDYFDNRRSMSGKQILNSYFLNLLRKFKINLYATVPSLYEVDIRFIRKINTHEKPRIYKDNSVKVGVYDKKSVFTSHKPNMVYTYDGSLFFKYYDTLEFHSSTYTNEENEIMEIVKNDTEFISYIENKIKKDVTTRMLANKFNISLTMSRNIIDKIVVEKILKGVK